MPAMLSIAHRKKLSMHDAFSIIALGFAYGTTVCSLTCLPYFGPYLMGTGRGFADGLASTLSFSVGKLCTYAALGGVAAAIGHAFTLQGAHKVIMGIVLLSVALTVPLVSRGSCHNRCQMLGKRGSLFFLGVASSLAPCPPLVAVFLLAANKGVVLSGIVYGFCYGLGMIISPMLLIGGGFAMISERIKKEVKGFAPFLQGAAMLIMIVMATNMIMTA